MGTKKKTPIKDKKRTYMLFVVLEIALKACGFDRDSISDLKKNAQWTASTNFLKSVFKVHDAIYSIVVIEK